MNCISSCFADENIDLTEDGTVDLELASSMIPEALPLNAGEAPISPHAHMEQAGLVLAGFRDCSEEAIRYLVDVEHLSEDDPLILGLKQHLWERQQHLDIERIISEHMCWSGSVQQQHQHHQDIARTDPMALSFLQQQQLLQQSQNSGASNPSSSGLHQFDISGGSASPHSDIQMFEVDDLNRSEDSSQLDLNDSSTSLTSQNSSPSSPVIPHVSHLVSSHPHHVGTSAQVQSEESLADADMSQSVLNLALLAQNNPAIASLTEELLSLLGGDQQDSDLDSDIDFEENQDSD